MRKLLITLTAVTLLGGGFAAPIAADSFVLQGDQDTGLLGVSPFAMNVSGTTDRVFYSGGPTGGGWSMSLCSPAGSCTGTALPFGFGTDYTQVTLNDGSMRAYFVQPGAGGSKSIATASVTYDATGTPQLGATTDLGISSAPEERAWGVPDSVVLSDGRVRLYWVGGSQDAGASKPTVVSKKKMLCLGKKLGKKRVAALSNGAKPNAQDKKALKRCKVPSSILSASRGSADEVILSTTSTDASGTTFVQDPGYRFTGGYVDSDIIQVSEGNWIALVSTGPGAPPQRLYAATSTDGLTWNVETKPLTSSRVNSLDPTAVQTGANTWRVYYSISPVVSLTASPAAEPSNDYRIVVGNLTRK